MCLHLLGLGIKTKGYVYIKCLYISKCDTYLQMIVSLSPSILLVIVVCFASIFRFSSNTNSFFFIAYMYNITLSFLA